MTLGTTYAWRAPRVVVLLLAGTSLAAAQAPRFQLPEPTGRFGVGTTSWLVADSNRTETLVASRTAREVRVIAWYPTARALPERPVPRAPYLRETIAEARTFATEVRAPGAYDALATVATHGVVDQPLLPGSAKFPVLVFSHGYTGAVSAYTALSEDLASHGFIVIGIAHPYEAMAVTLSNGRVATLLDSTDKLHRAILDVIEEWSVEDSTMARVTGAADENAQLAILRGYIGGNPHTREVIDRWVKDTKLVLDKLSDQPAASVSAQLARRINPARIGVLGHSMGGVVAGQFCIEDTRCRAGLNLDGIPQSGTMIDAKMKAPFLMVYSARPGRVGASDAIYRRAASAYYRVDVDSTKHIDFSDMNFWGGPLDAPGGHGPMTPLRAAELTRLIVREYFDQELLGRPSPLLSGALKIPELRVRRVR